MTRARARSLPPPPAGAPKPSYRPHAPPPGTSGIHLHPKWRAACVAVPPQQARVSPVSRAADRQPRLVRGFCLLRSSCPPSARPIPIISGKALSKEGTGTALVVLKGRSESLPASKTYSFN